MINAAKSASVLMLILTINGIPMKAYSDENSEISGTMAKSVQIACQEFEKKLDVNWENYLVNVYEADTYFIVSFRSKNVSAELRGSPKGIPGFEIKIRKATHEVMESQFIR
jgi:hypothetical protein